MLKETLQRPISLSDALLVIVILILLAGNIWLGFRLLNAQTELRASRDTINRVSTNERVLNFTSLFINKVLKAQGEINFDTWLELEQAVRGLKDEEILAQWQKFTNSQNEAEAQEEVKKLLEMLINKIEVK